MNHLPKICLVWPVILNVNKLIVGWLTIAVILSCFEIRVHFVTANFILFVTSVNYLDKYIYMLNSKDIQVKKICTALLVRFVYLFIYFKVIITLTTFRCLQPPKVKAFIDKVIQCPLQDIQIPLSGFRWEYSKVCVYALLLIVNLLPFYSSTYLFL